MELEYVLLHRRIFDSFCEAGIVPVDGGNVISTRRGCSVEVLEWVRGIYEIIFTSIFAS